MFKIFACLSEMVTDRPSGAEMVTDGPLVMVVNGYIVWLTLHVGALTLEFVR